jgi:rod shape-determining protein MreC
VESFFSRYRNEWFLLGVLFAQVIGLATQVRVGTPNGSQSGAPRLIRVWAVAMISPFQKLAANAGGGISYLWRDYIDLRGVRRENEELQRTIQQLRIDQTRMQQDAEQGRRLQALLAFKEQFIAKTVAAQVIGSSGTDLARVVYIDRGVRDGIQPGMAVITPDGIVGKISRADRGTAQVLLISDPQSGAGVLLERLRINGILKGSNAGHPEVLNVMADEKIEVGDRIVTTGGDRVFPKGLAVGAVESFAPDRERDPVMSIKVKPAVNLGRLEEVLVITEMGERQGSLNAEAGAPQRAADLLAERLPSVPKKTEDQKQKEVAAGGVVADSVPEGTDTAITSNPTETKPRAVPPPSTEGKPR